MKMCCWSGETVEDLGAESSAITLRPICCGHPLLRLSVIIRLKTLQGKHICMLRMTWSDSTTGYESQSPQFTAIGLHIWTGGNKEAQSHKHPVFIVRAKDHGNEYANYLSIRTCFQAAKHFFSQNRSCSCLMVFIVLNHYKEFHPSVPDGTYDHDG